MYNPPTFLTKEVLSEILSEVIWPDSFSIGDDGCPADGIEVRFPKCNLYFREGFESNMSLFISNPNSKEMEHWALFDVIHYFFEPEAKKNKLYKEPILSDFFSPFASLEKVKNGVRNLCVLLQTYLLPCIAGDFSWVEEYNRRYNLS